MRPIAKSKSALVELVRWGLLAALATLPAIALTSCVQVKTDPIRIEPIYIEITINHRIQRELDDLFGAIDQASETMEYQPLETKED